MMKTALLILLSLFFFGRLSADIVFLEYPQDLQLFGRNKTSGTGTINIKGYYKQHNPHMYQSLKTYLYRGNDVVGLRIVDLSPDLDSTWFHVAFNIPAELQDYRVATYGYSENDSTLVKQAQRLVCGDVFVIQGQSNAEAKKRGPQSVAYLSSDFIRAFAGGNPEPAQLQDHLQWYIGQGDGDRNTMGNCGQWGLFMARKLIDSLHIPIAIFNGAHGGTGINFFQRDSFYKTQLNSNYSRLYKRVKDSGLVDFIEVIFWAQGEHDAASNQSTTIESYQNKFNQLYANWKEDFPNLQRVILFQTAKGCETPLAKMQIVTEAQRQIAENNSSVTLIPTHGIPFRTADSCHFEFEAGYRVFADRAFYTLMKETYNKPQPLDLSCPKPENIEMISNNTIRLKFDKEIRLIDSLGQDFFLNNNPAFHCVKMKAHMNYLDLTFDYTLTPLTTLSYSGNNTLTPSFTATNGVETPRFSSLGIVGPLELKKNDFYHYIAYPNPVQGTVYLNPVMEIDWIRIYDGFGTLILEKKAGEVSQILDISPLTPGLYFIETNSGKQKITVSK